jgi:hypothetical protein
MDEIWEAKKLDMIRRGQKERVEFLEKLNKQLVPSQIIRIQQNDKTVLNEIVLPAWLDWETLYIWSLQTKIKEGRPCILCSQFSKNGMDFMDKFICESCFLKIKNM